MICIFQKLKTKIISNRLLEITFFSSVNEINFFFKEYVFSFYKYINFSF